MLVINSFIHDLVKKSRFAVAKLPLVLSNAVAFISVPPKKMHNSISRYIPFEVSGISTTIFPMQDPTEELGLVEVKS